MQPACHRRDSASPMRKQITHTLLLYEGVVFQSQGRPISEGHRVYTAQPNGLIVGLILLKTHPCFEDCISGFVPSILQIFLVVGCDTWKHHVPRLWVCPETSDQLLRTCKCIQSTRPGLCDSPNPSSACGTASSQIRNHGHRRLLVPHLSPNPHNR